MLFVTIHFLPIMDIDMKDSVWRRKYPDETLSRRAQQLASLPRRKRFPSDPVVHERILHAA